MADKTIVYDVDSSVGVIDNGIVDACYPSMKIRKISTLKFEDKVALLKGLLSNSISDIFVNYPQVIDSLEEVFKAYNKRNLDIINYYVKKSDVDMLTESTKDALLANNNVVSQYMAFWETLLVLVSPNKNQRSVTEYVRRYNKNVSACERLVFMSSRKDGRDEDELTYHRNLIAHSVVFDTNAGIIPDEETKEMLSKLERVLYFALADTEHILPRKPCSS